MKTKETAKKLRESFKTAERDEKSGLKHKGLVFRGFNDEEAKRYIEKAKKELELCAFYKDMGFL